MSRPRKNLTQITCTCLAASLLMGCASFKSPMTWFGNKSNPTRNESFAAKASETGKGLGGQLKSMGSTIGSAYKKTTSAVKNTFSTKEKSELGDDPTSLANLPDNLGSEIFVTNGQLYESQGNFNKALDNYTKALEREPNSEVALLCTARLYARQKQHAEASEFFSKALQVSQTPETFNELAMSLQSQGRNAEAQSAVQKAVELDPQNPRFRNNLAGMLVNSGRSEEAVAELQEVFPPAVANYNVAYLHIQNRNVAAAREHLQVALQHDPNFGKARELLAQAGESAVGQSSLAAYQAAKDIYRTAEAVTGQPINANPAVYQIPGNAPQQPYTSQPAGQSPMSNLGLPSVR